LEGVRRLALAKAFRETGLENLLNLSFSGSSGLSRGVCDGLESVLGDRSSEGVEDCLSIIQNLGRNPNAREGGGHIHGANLGMSDIVDLSLRHKSSLELSELFREGSSLRLDLG
jgi:hypothetical protein